MINLPRKRLDQRSAAELDRLPKVELHLHLDCCLSYPAAARLEPGLTRADFDTDFVAPPRLDGLGDFLSRTHRHLDLLQSAEALEACTRDLYEQLVADNVVYAEARFAPHQHTRRGLTPEQAVAAVATTMSQLNAGGPSTCRLLLCGLWSDPSEHTREVLRLARAARAGGVVVGIDVAGNEAHPNRRAHLGVLAEARAEGVPFTVHAGEGAGAPAVREVLDELDADRIGHGVRAIEDESLLRRLADAGTHLEMCPSCNVQLGLYNDLGEHPIRRFVQAGVSVGISTDQRTITNTTVGEEYRRLAAADPFWTPERFRARNRDALAASFADDETKQLIRARLDATT